MTDAFSAPRYTSAEVAKAVNWPVETLRSAIKRREIKAIGEVILTDDESPLEPPEPVQLHPGIGRSRLFSMRRALHVAIVAELTKLKFSVGDASMLALRFSDVGESFVYRNGESRVVTPRPPGGLFNDDTTVFVVRFRATDGSPTGTVERLSTCYGTLLKQGAQTHEQRFSAALVIDLTALAEKTFAALGVPPESEVRAPARG